MTRLMTLALEGRPDEWEPVTLGLRDALVADARAASPYWAAHAPEGMPFEAIPPLTKAIIRERWDDLRCAGVPEERCAYGVTSGSSGEPGRFLIDIEAYGAQRGGLNALHALCDIPLDVITCSSRAEDAPGDPPEGHAYFSTADLGPGAVAGIVAHWSALGRYVLAVQSSAMAPILDAMERLGGLRPDPGPLAIVASRDMMTPDLRRRVADAFGCPVHLWYGSREICGFLASTVDARDAGYAVNPFLCHFEVVDDEGRPLPPGRLGRVLITDLHNRALPMIRYDTGDLGRRAARTHGAWPVLEALEGRTSEVMYRADGSTLTLADAGHRLFGEADHTRWISSFQFFQDAGSGAIELRVVWRETPDPATVERMVADLRPAVREGIALRIVPVERLETLPSGKRWVVRRA